MHLTNVLEEHHRINLVNRFLERLGFPCTSALDVSVGKRAH
jgi:hypothetical protein